jgi:NTP pyrophosphatase (non-canonical NTP hydrolase)
MSDSGKPEGLPSELADIVIRVMDVCGGLGIDLDEEIRLKMSHNRRRPAMHNKLA